MVATCTFASAGNTWLTDLRISQACTDVSAVAQGGTGVDTKFRGHCFDKTVLNKTAYLCW